MPSKTAATEDQPIWVTWTVASSHGVSVPFHQRYRGCSSIFYLLGDLPVRQAVFAVRRIPDTRDAPCEPRMLGKHRDSCRVWGNTLLRCVVRTVVRDEHRVVRTCKDVVVRHEIALLVLRD